MAAPKTRITGASVSGFINAIKDEQVRRDCRTIAGIMQTATRSKPRMWGSNLVGFGTYRYKYADGHEAEWMLTAFSPRKQNITLYVSVGFPGRNELLETLGTHTCGKSCVYIKRLAHIHLPTLRKLVTASVRHTRRVNA